jgi:hypothetical protein
MNDFVVAPEIRSDVTKTIVSGWRKLQAMSVSCEFICLLQNPPKYEYGYNIQDGKGASHGKLEARDGIYALGRYKNIYLYNFR